MESLQGDDSTCIWCGDALEPDWRAVVVIDEDERCYADYPEYYGDPKMRGISRTYGHTSCMLESVKGFQLYRAWERGPEEAAEEE
jgi:hypothetical protein